MNNKLLSMLLAGGGFFLLPFFCNPYAASPELQLEPPKLVAIFLLGSVLFGCYLSRRIHWLIGLILPVFSFNVMMSGYGVMQMYGWAYLVSAILISLWFIELSEWQKGIIFKAIVLSGVVSGAYAITQMLGKDPIFNYAPGIDSTLPIAFLGQTTKYGAFMAICFGIAMAYDYALLSLFIGIMGLFSMSSMTFAAMLAVFIVRSRRWNYGLVISRYTTLVCGGALLLGVLIRPDANIYFSHGRVEIWKATLSAWWNGRRLFGFGPGSFEVLFAENFQPASTHGMGIFTRAHSDYIQLIFEFGFAGVFILSLFAYCIFCYYRLFLHRPLLGIKKSQVAAECALTAICVNALANFPFLLGPHYLIGIMSLSILLKSLKDSDTLKI
jgi:hypothetical protein